MSIAIAPNIEALVGGWLREHEAIAALGARVAGKTPDKMMAPWIRVTLLTQDDDPRSAREYLFTNLLQLDCYAGKTAMDAHDGQMEAWTLKANARAVLKTMQGEAADGVVVTRVRFTGDGRFPDTTMEPARERYILTVEITAHASGV